MEENQNYEVNGTSNGLNNVKNLLKEKKNLIIAIVVAIVAIIVVYNVFFNTNGKIKSVINTYGKAIGNGKYEKALKQIDAAGMYTFQGLDEDEYEDFWSEYKDYKKSDEWEEKEENWKELLDEAKDAEDDFDKEDAYKFNVKKITKCKKIGKNLYEVKAKVETVIDDEEDTDTEMFYVMKDGLSYKLVGGSGVSTILFSVGK